MSEKKISDNLLSKIAQLYYNEGATQDQISKKINLSRTQVNRYLKEARNRKIVKIEVVVINEKFNEMERLIEKNYKIKECIIVDSNQNINDIYKSLSVKFCELIERIIDSIEFIGVGWGKTLYNTLIRSDFKRAYKTQILPLIGGLGITDSDMSTNAIAKIFADKIGGKNLLIHSSALYDTKEVRDMIINESRIKLIMDLYKKINIAVVGIGDLSPDVTFIKAIGLDNEKINMLKAMGIIGEICGLFIDKNGVFVPNEINDRMISIKFDDLKSIKNVIGISFGNSKIEIIKAALNSKVIDILITDIETAEELIKA